MRDDTIKKTKSFYLYSGNGGPWSCGYCEFVNFDLRTVCLKCKKGIRPPFQPGLPWLCLDPECEYLINDWESNTCSRCGGEKWTPST